MYLLSIRAFAKLACIVFLLCMFKFAYGIEMHTKEWNSVIFTGPLSTENNRLKYYVEPDLRFIDDNYKFSQAFFWLGLGYQVAPTLVLYAGDATGTTRGLSGVYRHYNIPWQQANWALGKAFSGDLESRTRLEEIKNTTEPVWAVKLREKLQLKIPIKTWEGHAIALSDEVFFNLQNPKWTNTPSIFSQNRAFMGLSTKLTQHVSFVIGYMNQYQLTKTKQLSNILVLSLEVNTG